MPPLYRLAEAAVYALLNFLPFLALALYPFRRCLRFSGRVTGALIAVLTAVQLALGVWAAFFASSPALVSAVSTVLYGAFYFLAVKMPLGKTVFTLLMLSNLANAVVVMAKCLEGQLFPALALESYRWSFSLMMLAVELVIGLPLFFYIKLVYTPAVEMEPSGMEWRYLWLIPATFYLAWYYAVYFNVARSSLEIALRPANAIAILLINVGAALVYSVVARLVLEKDRITQLQRNNHQLAMRALQYENLQEKITEARRAKHDVRHHIALMQEYLQSGSYAALEEYLGQYQRSLPDDTLIRFCENTAVNAVLLYFAQQAKNAGVDYIVRAAVPESCGMEETDLSVLFGNLLENALDACRASAAADPKIITRAEADAHSLCLTVDNTFAGHLPETEDGAFRSSKHPGRGLGTESVRAITEKYGGVCKWETHDGLLYASVICYF